MDKNNGIFLQFDCGSDKTGEVVLAKSEVQHPWFIPLERRSRALLMTPDAVMTRIRMTYPVTLIQKKQVTLQVQQKRQCSRK